MTPNAEIIRTTHLPQFGGIYFGLKNQYKIVLNRVDIPVLATFGAVLATMF